ncbi:hypothetical protein G7068_16290 [Leucobacter viscericola]|uniref:Uncharacterized protein n=1 Tax=Leucobacter viscericola TaxID=2714935 RepID=A0A6G7XJQ4_9MICO|nr:hypothetical protein [Leucobacter viscericola]QIK64607.1 hypothetical protein G7068_16290 [Leucobacter viscericola]
MRELDAPGCDGGDTLSLVWIDPSVISRIHSTPGSFDLMGAPVIKPWLTGLYKDSELVFA